MPELPEVETVLRALEHRIHGRKIVDVKVYYDAIIDGDVNVFVETLKNQSFQKFLRRGKYLIFQMDTCFFVSHLRMEGKYFIKEANEPLNKHEHVVFTLDDGMTLRYHDTRKFGRMELWPLDCDFNTFHNLGVEPNTDAFTSEYVYEVCKKKDMPLKTLLLKQDFIAGIGNIYADEILFATSLRPGRSCKRITKKDSVGIVEETNRILREAIQAGGTTIRSYTSIEGVHGRFQLSCMVHEQKVCKVCGTKIQMKRIGGRSSYYCPVCQK